MKHDLSIDCVSNAYRKWKQCYNFVYFPKARKAQKFYNFTRKRGRGETDQILEKIVLLKETLWQEFKK